MESSENAWTFCERIMLALGRYQIPEYSNPTNPGLSDQQHVRSGKESMFEKAFTIDLTPKGASKGRGVDKVSCLFHFKVVMRDRSLRKRIHVSPCP